MTTQKRRWCLLIYILALYGSYDVALAEPLEGTLKGIDEKRKLISVDIDGQERVFPILPQTQLCVFAIGTREFLDVGYWVDFYGKWKPGTNLIRCGFITSRPGRNLARSSSLTVHLLPKYSINRQKHLFGAKSTDWLQVKLAGPIVSTEPFQIKASGLKSTQWSADQKLVIQNGQVSFVTGKGVARSAVHNFGGKTLEFENGIPEEGLVKLNLGPHLEYAGEDAKVTVIITNNIPAYIGVTRVDETPLTPDDVVIGSKAEKSRKKAATKKRTERRPKAQTDTKAKRAASVRTWTDSTGKHKVRAKLLAFKDDKVHLEKLDGSTAVLSINRLSRRDQEVVRAWDKDANTEREDQGKPHE